MEKVEIHPSMSDARTGPGSFSPTRQANNKAIKILKHDDDASWLKEKISTEWRARAFRRFINASSLPFLSDFEGFVETSHKE